MGWQGKADLELQEAIKLVQEAGHVVKLKKQRKTTVWLYKIPKGKDDVIEVRATDNRKVELPDGTMKAQVDLTTLEWVAA